MSRADDLLESLFAACACLPPVERAKFLDRNCGGDPVIHGRLAALLRAHDRPRHFLDSPAANGMDPTSVRSAEAGIIIAGRYKLLEEIGEGGMGAVWLAEQMEPVKRKVAVKLIKPGMDSRSVLGRFEAERQALALMDHPNIAKVLDGGVIGETRGEGREAREDMSALPSHPSPLASRPFFVMEYVKGVPITDYCDTARLKVPDRLQLFVAVCNAVQHAHQKGVIHRDLKPSNILVAPYDETPVPKVIDFGLAKAVRQPLTENTLFMAHDTVLGTPLYMSPEQAQLNNLDVDTRSDVYALGVLLYELLTGTTPLEKRRFKEAAWDEVRRLIREEEPPRPSARLSSTDTLPSLAAARQSEPAKLTRLVRGDLDWIVMKALAKERNRRYQTANALARDLERYLNDEPVEACPPSVTYRVTKLLRRHKGPVLAAAVVLLALVAGVVGTTWGLWRAEQALEQAESAQRAEAERARAERQAREEAQVAEKLAAERLIQVAAEQKQTEAAKQRAEVNAQQAVAEKRIADAVRDFLQSKLLGQADVQTQADALLLDGGQASAANRNLTVRQLLDRAAAELAPERIEASFPKQPLVQAEILHIVGETYRGVGEYALALSFLRRAAALRQQHLGPHHPHTLATLNNVAGAYFFGGNLAEAIKLYEEIRAVSETKLGPEHPHTLVMLNNLALAYQVAGKLPEAIKLFERAHAAAERALGFEHPNSMTMRNTLAGAYQQAGRLPEAIMLYEQARALREIRLGPDHPSTLNTVHHLAVAYLDAGRRSEGTKMLEQVRVAQETRLGPDHPDTLITVASLAGAYRLIGKQAEAMQILEQVRAAEETKLGPDHPHTLKTLGNLAAMYWFAGRLDKSIPLFERALKGQEAKLGRDNPATLLTMANLGVNYRDAGRLAEGIPLQEEAYRKGRERAGLDNFGDELVMAYVKAGKQAEASRLIQDRIAIARKKFQPEQMQLAGLLAFYGKRSVEVKQYSTAEPLLRESLIMHQKLSERKQAAKWQVARVQLYLGDALLGQKKYAEAEPVLLAAYAGLKRSKKAIPPNAQASPADALERIIEAYEGMAKETEAARWRKERQSPHAP